MDETVSTGDSSSGTGDTGSGDSTTDDAASGGSGGNGGSDGTSITSGGSGGTSVVGGSSDVTSITSGGSGGTAAGTTGPAVGSTGSMGATGSDPCVFGFCSCVPVSTSVALDERTPLGFSAEQVLAFAAGPHAASATYDLYDATGFELTLPNQPSALTLTIEPIGSARFVANSSVANASFCTNLLEIDVEATLSTADGTFNEHFSDKLLAEDASRAHLITTIDFDSLDGNLSLGLPEEASLPSLPELYVVFGKDFFVGDITGEIGSCSDDLCSVGSVTFAAWNDSDCQDRRLPVRSADEATPLVERILDEVTAPSPFTVTWGNGATSDLFVEAASSNATLCHQPEGILMDSVGEERFWLNTELLLSSGDERLDATLPVSIDMLYRSDGGPIMAFIDNYDYEVPAEASAFEETYGLADVDFNGALEGYLYFYLDLRYEVGLPTSAIGGLDVREGETVIEPIGISKQE